MKAGRHNSKRRGYTLMEMMVVLALIAVAAALVVPSVGHAFGNLELRMTASTVASLFKQARTQAVYKGHLTMVVFGPSQDRSRTLLLVQDDGQHLARVSLSPGIVLRAEQRGEWSTELQPVHFYPDGSSDALQLDFQGHDRRHVQLALNPLTGWANVSLVYSSGDAAGPGAAPEEPVDSVTVTQGGQR